MEQKQKIIIAIVAIFLAAVIGYFTFGRDVLRKKTAQRISIEQPAKLEETTGPANTGPVSPLSGIACEHWNRRPLAVMQPSDTQARPVAGLSDADMVFELPTPAEGIFVTRLMGVYLCNTPVEIGSMRSGRHDYIAIAKGLDAVYVPWGGSAFALNKLKEGVIESINCNSDGGKSAPECCFRKPLGVDGLNRVEDTGYAKGEELWKCSQKFGYRQEIQFDGYPHQNERPREERIQGGHLLVGYPGKFRVEYDYDPETNSYLRTWGSVTDIDRNGKKRHAPKNVVVMFAENEQILAETDYKARGVQDPWEGIPEIKKTGAQTITGRYNNLQIGDPWFDTKETGSAKYYFNGQEYNGTWKKSKASGNSKLYFYDESGKEIRFVPGQIWVEVVIPEMKVEWREGTSVASSETTAATPAIETTPSE